MSPSWPLPGNPEPWQPREPGDWMLPLSRDGRSRLRVLGSDGRYRLRRLLDRGGQAYIWEALDTRDGGLVVIKTARDDQDRSPDISSRRLVREARILQTLRGGAHVLRLQDWGPHHLRVATDDGDDGDDDSDDPSAAMYAWLVFPVHIPWLLGDALRRFGPFGVETGTHVARELAVALRNVHCHETVHRDVSPGNVLLTPSGVVLADFGQAWTRRYVADDVERQMSSGLTRAVGPERTPAWWAPELDRKEGEQVVPTGRPDRSRAADMFCWGLYVFAAVTGRHPWSLAVGQIVLGLEEPEFAQFRRGQEVECDVGLEIPDERLAGLVEAALSPVPAERPTAEEIVAALEPGAPPFRRRYVGRDADDGDAAVAGDAPDGAGRLDPRLVVWGVLGLLGFLVCGLAMLRVLPAVVLARFDLLGDGGTGLLAVAFLAVGAIALVRMQTRPVVRHTEAEVDEHLARAVRRQWESEVAIRRLRDPYPLPVSWRPAPEHLFVSWESIVDAARDGMGVRDGSAGWVTTTEGLRGTRNEMVDVVARRVPMRRLVVLGEPGAGKTMLLVSLVLGVLVNRSAVDGRIPVLLSLASWNPAEQHLQDWLRHVIATDYPWLRQPAPGRPVRTATHIERLLDQHRIFPILDGLDEIPEAERAFAIEKINDWLGSSTDNQLVLSCRLDEYAAMVAPSAGVAGAKLSGSTGVILQELEPDDVRKYLERDARDDAGAARWQPVFDEFGTGRPVDAALRIPLMVGLARTIYNPRGGQPLPEVGPAELCEIERFPDQASVERHLFEGFVPAAYREHPDPARRCRWSAEQSARWLRNVARHLGDPFEAAGAGPVGRAPLGRTDLAWWELHASVSPWLIGAVAAVVPAVAVGVAAALGPALGVGLGLGLVIGVVVAVALRGWPGPALTSRLTARWTGGPVAGIAVSAALAVLGAMVGGLAGAPFGLGKGLTGGLVGAVGVGLGVGPVGSLLSCLVGGFAGGVAVGVTAGAGAGLPAGVACGLGAGVATAAILVLAGRLKPARGLRGSDWSWQPAIAAGAVAGIGLGLTAGVGAGIVGAIAGSCLGLLNPDADPKSATSPRVSLGRDRSTFLAFGLASGVTVAVGASLAVLPIVGAAGGITVGLVFGTLQAAWGRYTIARILLALRKELPWRLTAFLADAHRERGVLRQVGAVYQFRHANLQRHLAESR